MQRTKIPKINERPINGANKANTLIYVDVSESNTSLAPKNLANCSLKVNPKHKITSDKPIMNKQADLKISCARLISPSPKLRPI